MGDENVLTLMKADKGDTLPQYNDFVVKYHWKGLGLLTGHTVTLRKGVDDVPGQNKVKQPNFDKLLFGKGWRKHL